MPTTITVIADQERGLVTSLKTHHTELAVVALPRIASNRRHDPGGIQLNTDRVETVGTGFAFVEVRSGTGQGLVRGDRIIWCDNRIALSTDTLKMEE